MITTISSASFRPTRTWTTCSAKGYGAWAELRHIPRMHGLPEPLPPAVPVAKLVGQVEYSDQMTVGESYEVKVEVRNNCEYTEKRVPVHASA